MIRRELGVFLIVGILTVLVDFVTYRGLLFSETMRTAPAKAVGFIAGTLFAYFANRFWTFGHTSPRKGSAWRFAVLYTSTLGANVFTNALALHFLRDTFAVVQIAFVCATAISASLNFFGMKFFVFKSHFVVESR